MSDRTCTYCGGACYDGYGYAKRGDICKDGQQRWVQIIQNVLGMDGLSWTDCGVDFEWRQFEQLIDRMDYDLPMRCRRTELVITDLQLCELFPLSEVIRAAI